MAKFYRFGGFTTDLKKLTCELNKHNPPGKQWDIYRHKQNGLFAAMRTDTGANIEDKINVLKSFGFDYYHGFVSVKPKPEDPHPHLKVVK